MPVEKDRTYHDASYCHLFSRIDINDASDVAVYQPLINQLIMDLSVNILRSTAGIHENAKNKHYHYHAILDQDFNKLNPKIANNNYYKNKLINKLGLKDKSRYMIVIHQPYTTPLLPAIDTAVHRFLRYPLKERKPILELCTDCSDTINGMMNSSEAEYQFALETKIKSENKDLMKITKYNDIESHLRELNIEVNQDNLWKIYYEINKYICRHDSIPPSDTSIKTYGDRYYNNNAPEEELEIKFKKMASNFQKKKLEDMTPQETAQYYLTKLKY